MEHACHFANGIVITLPQALSNGYCLVGDNGRQQYLKFCLFEMYVSVVFAIRFLYSAVSLALVKERFIRIIDDDDDDYYCC